MASDVDRLLDPQPPLRPILLRWLAYARETQDGLIFRPPSMEEVRIVPLGSAALRALQLSHRRWPEDQREAAKVFLKAAETHTALEAASRCRGHAEGLLHAVDGLEEAITDLFVLWPPEDDCEDES